MARLRLLSYSACHFVILMCSPCLWLALSDWSYIALSNTRRAPPPRICCIAASERAGVLHAYRATGQNILKGGGMKKRPEASNKRQAAASTAGDMLSA